MKPRRTLDLDRALEELSEEATTSTFGVFAIRLCGSRTLFELGRADTEPNVVRIVHSKRHETTPGSR